MYTIRMLVYCFLGMGITMQLLHRLALQDVEKLYELSAADKRGCVIRCLLNSLLSGYLYSTGKKAGLLVESSMSDRVIVLLVSVFSGCLLMACLTDQNCCKVYHFTWWIGGCAGGLLLAGAFFGRGCEGRTIAASLTPLLLYGILQEVVFCRMYGRADCHAFFCCAIVEASCGIGLMGYLLHMLTAFGLLACRQAQRRNIDRRGNLKQPVAFLPYITLSFWIILTVAASHGGISVPYGR